MKNKQRTATNSRKFNSSSNNAAPVTSHGNLPAFDPSSYLDSDTTPQQRLVGRILSFVEPDPSDLPELNITEAELEALLNGSNNQAATPTALTSQGNSDPLTFEWEPIWRPLKDVFGKFLPEKLDAAEATEQWCKARDHYKSNLEKIDQEFKHEQRTLDRYTQKTQKAQKTQKTQKQILAARTVRVQDRYKHAAAILELAVQYTRFKRQVKFFKEYASWLNISLATESSSSENKELAAHYDDLKNSPEARLRREARQYAQRVTIKITMDIERLLKTLRISSNLSKSLADKSCPNLDDALPILRRVFGLVFESLKSGDEDELMEAAGQAQEIIDGLPPATSENPPASYFQENYRQFQSLAQRARDEVRRPSPSSHGTLYLGPQTCSEATRSNQTELTLVPLPLLNKRLSNFGLFQQPPPTKNQRTETVTSDSTLGSPAGLSFKYGP